MKLYQQVLVILAGAHGFIAPFIKDFKKDLSVICALYEQSLLKFAVGTEEREDFFYPFYELLSLADKTDFDFASNPLLFVLRSFEPTFYKTIN